MDGSSETDSLSKQSNSKKLQQLVIWFVKKIVIKLQNLNTFTAEWFINETDNIYQDKELSKKRYISPEKGQKIIAN